MTLPDLSQSSSDDQGIREAAQAALDAWDAFNSPAVKIAPLYPRMEDLRIALHGPDAKRPRQLWPKDAPKAAVTASSA